MKTEDLKEKFAELYAKMATSKKVANMKMFGTAFTELYNKVAVSMPELAYDTLETLEGIEYCNYVSHAEAQAIAANFINDDKLLANQREDSKGPHWSPEVVKSVLSSREIALDEKPYFNWWALWLTINMVYSDYADTLADLLATKDQEKLAVACYKLAIRHLKDPDRAEFIRAYFGLDK